MVLEKRDGKLPLSNKSLGVPCSEGPALNFPTSDGGGAWEGGEGAGEQRTLFSTAKDPLLALGTGIADLLLLPQPKPGKIFPKIIPNPPDEKPNCTRDLLEKIERERERERERTAQSEGELTAEGTARGEEESSRAPAETPFGRKSQHS